MLGIMTDTFTGLRRHDTGRGRGTFCKAFSPINKTFKMLTIRPQLFVRRSHRSFGCNRSCYRVSNKGDFRSTRLSLPQGSPELAARLTRADTALIGKAVP